MEGLLWWVRILLLIAADRIEPCLGLHQLATVISDWFLPWAEPTSDRLETRLGLEHTNVIVLILEQRAWVHE